MWLVIFISISVKPFSLGKDLLFRFDLKCSVTLTFVPEATKSPQLALNIGFSFWSLDSLFKLENHISQSTNSLPCS